MAKSRHKQIMKTFGGRLLKAREAASYSRPSSLQEFSASSRTLIASTNAGMPSPTTTP